MSSILYFLPHSSSCTLKFQLINKIYPPFSLSDSSCLLINSLKLPTEKTNQKKLSKIKSCSESQSKNLRTCKNCKTQFDPVHNHPLACRFHIAHFGGETKRKFESVYTGGTLDTPNSGQVFQYWHCCGSEDPFDQGCTSAPHSSYDD
ncbi:uncharacterized protein LOC130802248 [Amaranthus tricolor]|uniref:uncharacterized protein LOC130802248 n=1 Tax=Amaranthus tricolor TaxID=29722 RepID=UPI002585B8A6|nr:uncharacterized protein LOC130802248 [Amaranthus tricolor]